MRIRRGLVLTLAMTALATIIGFAGEQGTPNASRVPGVAAGYAGNSAAGELFPTMMGTALSAQREFRRALPSIYSYSQTAHHQNRADIGSSDALASFDASTLASVACPTTMCSPGSKWVMWDVPFMVNETKKRKDRYLGYEQNVSGFATGISRLIGESSAIGFAIGYDYRKLDGRDKYHMKNRADALHLALYGGTGIGHWFIDGYAGYSRAWNRTERSIYASDARDLAGTTHGNFNDTVLSAGAKVSYVWILPNDMRITPSAGVDLSHVRSSGLTEKVSPSGIANTALRVDKNNYTSVAVPLMVSLNKTYSWNRLCFGGSESLWTPEIRGGYVASFGAERASTRNAFVNNPGQTWKVNSTNLDGGYGTVGAGMKLKIRDKYIFALEYDYTFASKYTNHSVTAMYGVSF